MLGEYSLEMGRRKSGSRYYHSQRFGQGVGRSLVGNHVGVRAAAGIDLIFLGAPYEQSVPNSAKNLF